MIDLKSMTIAEMEEYLKEQGVEHLQGFYYSKPVPGDQFIKYIQAQCG